MGIIDKLGSEFSSYSNALDLRSYRNEVLASNIANADTPYYKAKDFNFYDVLRNQKELLRRSQTSLALEITNSHHLKGKVYKKELVQLQYRNSFQPSIDGNTVDLDIERANFTDNSLRYQTTISFLNSRIQGLNSAIKGE